MTNRKTINLLHEEEMIGLVFDERILTLLATSQPHPKGAPKERKRLIRIRHRLFETLAAMNKELKRHKLDNRVTIEKSRI